MSLLIAFIIGRRKLFILRNGERTKAKIVGIEVKRELGKARYYVLQYKANGQDTRCHYDIGSQYSTRKDIGKEVKIAYDTNNPKEIIIINDYAFYLGLIFLCTLGVALITMSFIVNFI